MNLLPPSLSCPVACPVLSFPVLSCPPSPRLLSPRLASPRASRPLALVAGNALFNVVVANESVAAELVALLNAERSGRVTFVPLSRIQHLQAPEPPKTSDAFAMLSRLKFKDQHAKAMVGGRARRAAGGRGGAAECSAAQAAERRRGE